MPLIPVPRQNCTHYQTSFRDSLRPHFLLLSFPQPSFARFLAVCEKAEFPKPIGELLQECHDVWGAVFSWL